MTNESGSNDERPTSQESGADATEGPGFTVQDGERESGGAERLPAVDFSTFVLSLAASALYHLGLAEGPDGEATPEKNLPLAHQTIDTLEMLEAKTRGNLDAAESQLLETVLYELRMGYVKASG